MLVECGFVRAQTDDGCEYTFTPSIGRIAALGSPVEIVNLFIDLNGDNPESSARYILYCLCDQEDPSKLLGCVDDNGIVEGLMPINEQVIIALHLMIHGIVGMAKPEKNGDGTYSEEFNASEYIACARVHLGLSTDDAEALSMTEFQKLMAMKFPDAGKNARDVPTRDEYNAAMAAMRKRRENVH